VGEVVATITGAGKRRGRGLSARGAHGQAAALGGRREGAAGP
jgi:hypothetical protein